MKHIAILGSTGSIGTSTLSIVASYPERFRVASLAAGSNVDLAFQQCARWRPLVASMATPELAAQLGARLRSSGITGTEVVYGSEGSVRAATLKEVDFVVSAIVGVAGLEATYAAVMAGKPVGLANKECMVAAGEILTRAAREECAAAADRLRTQRDPPVHAGGDAAGGEADLADRVGRPVPPVAAA